MIQTGIKTNSILDFLKDYLSVLIIVPAFLGGLWQALELTSISISYIRFFSISQIVPDGILIIMLFLLGAIPHFLSIYKARLFDEKNEDNDDATPPSEKHIRNTFRFALAFYILGFIYFSLGLYAGGTVSDLSLGTLIAVSSIYCINLLLNKCYESGVYYSKELLKFYNVFLFIYYLLITFYFVKHIHASFLITDNLDNIENVNSLMQKRYPCAERKILYFNDKYIFIKIINKSIIDVTTKKPLEKIHIVKLESLFNE